MPRTEMEKLDSDARAWVFGISPSLDEKQSALLLQEVDLFLRDWQVHGHPITSAREIRDGAFLVIAIEKTTENSGCSIDRLYGTLLQLESQLDVSILGSDRVFFRHGDRRVDAMSRAEFRQKADAHTIVFDTTAATLGEITSGRWERRAGESWHGELLKQPAAS